jgi:chromosome partitioning protein
MRTSNAVTAKFTPRRLEFKARQAIRLLGNPRGVPVDTIQFRQAAGDVKTQMQGATYHNVYGPDDVRRVRELLDPEYMAMLSRKINGLPPIICVHVTKGGVGKTSVTASVAVAFAAQGFKTLLIDGDPQGSTTETFGIDTEAEGLKTLRNVMHHSSEQCRPEDAVIAVYENAMLDLIPADNFMNRYEKELASMRLAESRFSRLVQGELKSFLGQYDIVLIDTGPASSVLNFNLMMASTLIVGVVSMDGMSLKTLTTLSNDIKDIEAAILKPLPTMLIANKFHAGQNHCNENYGRLKEIHGDVLCDNKIPVSTGFDRQVNVFDPDASRPLFEKEIGSAPSEAILNISRALISKVIEEPRRSVHNESTTSAVAA